MQSILTSWGEWCAESRDGSPQLRSAIGRLGEPSYGCGDGRGLPPIWEPRDVAMARRLINRMLDSSRAGERYLELITRSYVRFENVTGSGIDRAERALVDLWVAER